MAPTTTTPTPTVPEAPQPVPPLPEPPAPDWCTPNGHMYYNPGVLCTPTSSPSVPTTTELTYWTPTIPPTAPEVVPFDTAPPATTEVAVGSHEPGTDVVTYYAEVAPTPASYEGDSLPVTGAGTEVFLIAAVIGVSLGGSLMAFARRR